MAFLPNRLTINRPALVLFVLLAGAGLAASVDPFNAASWQDRALLIGAAGTQALMLAATAALLGALASSRRSLSLSFWTLAFIAAGLMVCDAISYRWLALHLGESMLMLSWYLQSNPAGIAGKLAALTTAAVVLIAGSLVSALALDVLCRRMPRLLVSLPTRRVLVLWIASMTAWAGVDMLAARSLSTAGFETWRDALWIQPVLTPRASRPGDSLFTIDSPDFVQLPSAASRREQLDRITPASVESPLNVFFFIVDSLRADTAASAVMPALASRRSGALTAERQVSGSNCTHVSWTSLLHGVNPLYWTVLLHQSTGTQQGSAGMIALKRAGYRLHTFSSYELNYFGVDRSLFGYANPLVDVTMGQKQLAALRPGGNVADLDTAVFEQMQAAARRPEAGNRNVYFGFLDALHHAYEWPRDFKPVFEPFMPAAEAVWNGMNGSQAERLRARYNNAARFIDGQFERFFDFLDASNLRESSIVVIAGDHGEEFFEEGRMAHASALNRYQLESPLLVFLPPSMHASGAVPLASSADVLPTVMRALGLDDDVAGLMTGMPMMDADRGARSAVSADCSTSTPDRLLVQTPSTKLLLEFDGIQKRGYSIFARGMRGVRLLDANYRPIARDAAAAGQVLDRPDVRAALSRFVMLPRR